MRVATGIAVTIGVTISFGLGHYLGKSEGSGGGFFTAEPVQAAAQVLQAPAAPETTTLTPEEVEASRQQHFADISTIADVLAIPTDFGQTEALYALAGRSDIEPLRALIAEAERIAIPGEREAALQILFSRYADIDTRAALIYLDGLNLDIAPSLVHGIFRSWAKVDPDAAIAAANQIGNPQHRKTAAEAILRTFADQSPQQLDLVAEQLVDSVNTEQFEIERMIRRGAADPQSALAEALALTDRRLRQQVIYGITLNLARRDPRRALEVVQAISDQPLQQQVTQAIVQQWARTDPQAAMDFARAEGLADTAHLTTLALQHVARKDPVAALEQASQLDRRARQSAYSGIYGVWAQQDVRAAINHAESLDDLQLAAQVYSSLGRQYAIQFPDEALLWAEQLDGSVKGVVTGAVLQEIANTDPQLALESALDTVPSPTRNNTISNIFRMLAGTDPQTAAAYLERLPAGPIRDQSAQNIIGTWAARDPEAAYLWVDQLQGNSYTQTVASLASHLAMANPDKAAQLTDQIRETARPHWLHAVAQGYAQKDYASAANWLKQYRGEPGYAQALASITQVAAQADPLAALDLAEDITSVMERRGAINNITQTWSSRDPAAAANWSVTLKDATQRSSSVRIAANQWANYDPDAARHWALGLDDDEIRDNALVGLINRQGASTDEALSLLSAIRSMERRADAVVSLVWSLAHYDPAQAERVLDQADLSEQKRSELKEHLRPRLNRD